MSPHREHPGLRGPGGLHGAKLLGQPHTSRQAELSPKLLPTEWWGRESAETRGGVQSYRPKTFQNHWKINTFQMLFRRLSCTTPLLAHACTFGVWSPAIPSYAESNLAKETITTTTDVKDSALKIKIQSSAKKRRVPGWGAWTRASGRLEVQHDGDAAVTGQLRDELGFPGMSRGWHPTAPGARATEPAAGQSLECHLRELQSNLLAHPLGKR